MLRNFSLLPTRTRDMPEVVSLRHRQALLNRSRLEAGKRNSPCCLKTAEKLGLTTHLAGRSNAILRTERRAAGRAAEEMFKRLLSAKGARGGGGTDTYQTLGADEAVPSQQYDYGADSSEGRFIPSPGDRGAATTSASSPGGAYVPPSYVDPNAPPPPPSYSSYSSPGGGGYTSAYSQGSYSPQPQPVPYSPYSQPPPQQYSYGAELAPVFGATRRMSCCLRKLRPLTSPSI